MDQERNETFERIPWETLERKGPDRQRLVVGVAAVVVVAALAYSFMRNQPIPPPVPGVSPTAVAASADPALTGTTAALDPSPPVVVAEADLYAVDPERLYDEAAARAEWFAVEYFSYDGSPADVLARMLPEGTPLPTAAPGVQVYVDWVGVLAVEEEGPGRFRARVVVRSLRSDDEAAFTRQDDRLVTLSLVVGKDGEMQVAGPPAVEVADPGGNQLLETGLPDEVMVAAEAEYGLVIGGRARDTGGWDVFVMMAGPDGVTRPEAVFVP